MVYTFVLSLAFPVLESTKWASKKKQKKKNIQTTKKPIVFLSHLIRHTLKRWESRFTCFYLLKSCFSRVTGQGATTTGHTCSTVGIEKFELREDFSCLMQRKSAHWTELEQEISPSGSAKQELPLVFATPFFALCQWSLDIHLFLHLRILSCKENTFWPSSQAQSADSGCTKTTTERTQMILW